MRSRFSIRGHPLHPMLVSLPIGLMLWALVADLVYLSGGREAWYTTSLWTGIAAFATAVVAALPGLGDYLTLARTSAARLAGLVHLLLNVLAIVLFALAAFLTWNVNPSTGDGFWLPALLHLAGVAAVAVSGWLGGEMVFRYRLAVHESEIAAIPEDRAHVGEPQPRRRA